MSWLRRIINFFKSNVMENHFTDNYEFPNGSVYKFRFAYMSHGYFEMDIMSQPSYLDLPDDLHTTHRLPSDRTDCDYRICFDPETALNTRQKAIAVAQAWAQYTERYIRRSINFPEKTR